MVQNVIARMCLQVIMELQCDGEAEAVDLSGDAGVVGRWLVQGDEDHPQLCMDLKGVLFSATTVRRSPVPGVLRSYGCAALHCSGCAHFKQSQLRLLQRATNLGAMPDL